MLKRPPSFESLRVLEACVRHANFTRAAAELALTPAAISLRIRNLEAALGLTLFRRCGPRLETTDAAVRLAGRVAEALCVVHAAVDDCRAAREPLRITAAPSFAARWLAPRLQRYHRRPGSVPIRLDASVELRPEDAFDVAIRTGRGDWHGFDVTPLTPIEATPMLSPELAASVNLATAADLAKLPLLPHPDWPRWFREAGVSVGRLRFCVSELPTHEFDAMAAMDAAGVALLSPSLFAEWIAQKKLIQPFQHVARGPSWHCALVKAAHAHPAAVDFRTWLLAEVRRDE